MSRNFLDVRFYYEADDSFDPDEIAKHLANPKGKRVDFKVRSFRVVAFGIEPTDPDGEGWIRRRK